MDEESQDQDFTDFPQDSSDTQKTADKDRVVSWTGSEFIDNKKNSGWFMGFFGALALVVVAIFILTRDYISTISIALVGTLFAVLAGRKPRQLSYKVDNKGLSIGSKFYSFEQFKYFSLARDGAIDYINLMPLKRFMPDVSIYFPPEETEKIVEILSDHLPHHEDGERQIDKLAKRLRF